MSIVRPKSQWQWLLLMLLSFVLVHAFEAPTKIQCEHDSIPDLIKSSPVILKALGARIFTDYENYPFQDDIEFTEELMLKARRRKLVGGDVGGNNVMSTATDRSGDDTNSDGNVSSSSSSETRLDDDNDDDDDDAFLSEDALTAGVQEVDGSVGRKGEVFNSHQWSGSESALITLTPETIYKGASALKITQQPDRMGESSYLYEEQLNATLEPLACFNSNILKLLPTEIIAFGKLVNDRRPDVLRISINGLHRWSPQFENRIWKYLGWDDWSDFTVCSVQCGKGVQQRFRRCLLDNPMISINMNLNGNEFQQQQQPQRLLQPPQQPSDALDTKSPSEKQSNASNQQYQQHQMQQQHHHHHHQLLHSRGSNIRRSSNIRSHSDSHEKNNISNNNANGTKSFPAVDEGGTTADSVSSNKLKKRRKRKKAKSLSTLSCEGYNIEQRNCNTFECTDDISDLLKFYKKFLPMEELPTTSMPQQPEQQSPTAPDSAQSAPVATTSSGSNAPAATTTASTTLPNTGYIRSWKNSLNFTLMITLRLKNDTKSTSTVFSVRNTTHNLYVETAADGLRLYQERDNATEMLPVKFQLYDNRWHQISISIQNGDFISIYVDCTWTNSFVVSKRLFSLPTDADVEIGRGFSGELQQLLVLPENQERYQCSNVRTSINEVKRYIIDTFIDDYGN